MSVAVLIPAYNEEEKIAETVSAAFKLPGVEQLLVIDDGSWDATAQRASGAGADVVRLSGNFGKGYALNRGAQYLNADIILLLDADLGCTASEAQKLLLPVENGTADMTIAVFPEKSRGGFGIVKGLAKWGVNTFGGLDLSSPLSGQRAMNKKTWHTLQPFASGFGVEVVSCINCGRYGIKVLEVKVDMDHNFTGRDLHGFLHRGKQFYHISSALFKEAVSHHPGKLGSH